MKKIAIIITGELRFESKKHFINFINKLKIYDIYISSYLKYKPFCLKITKLENCVFIDTNSDIDIGGIKDSIWQWLHLSHCIKTFHQKLLTYDYIIKLRTDIEIHLHKFTLDHYIQNIKNNTIYANTDIIFYAKAKYFIEVYENFFELIKTIYWNKINIYIPINYKNLLSSNISLIKFKWFILPKIIYSNDQQILKKNIKNNLKFLNNCNFENIELIFPHAFPKDKHFSPELIFGIHALNNGYIDIPPFHITLMKGRKKWTFSL
jgi:hypothetical protein